ncbi:MAG: SDR family NAD(P)-dependent oxidoreductase [Saprospirales bacterium]|nr:SDR family NAD(P)-dependent oxidoreductase [Saprospirales bacterium]
MIHQKAVKEIKSRHSALDALLNIAAVFRPNKEVNSTGLEWMFAANHLGPFVLTNELLDLLKAGKPSRVINVTAPSTTKVNFDDLHGTKIFLRFSRLFWSLQNDEPFIYLCLGQKNRKHRGQYKCISSGPG